MNRNQSNEDNISNLTTRSASAPPQDQLDDIDPTTPAVTNTATPPSDLLSATSENSNTKPNIKIETEEFDNETFALPLEEMPFLAVPDEIISSPQINDDDEKLAADRSPEKKLSSPTSNDNFLSSVLTSTTPINRSNSFLNFGSTIDYFSNFEFESLNGLFGSPNGATSQTRFPLENVPQQLPQPPMEAFPLPSYLQAQLDDTYAASAIILPNDNDANKENGVFYQVTAYRHKPTYAATGSVPIHPRSSDTAQNKENVPPKTKVGNNRLLPLRKRPIEDVPLPPLGAKKMLIRHNMKEEGDEISCGCKNSRCLKLYCDCFRLGKICKEGECICIGCKNTEKHSGLNGVRTKAISEILRRRPDAFGKREKKADEGCKCKKNKCLKKYCVCFNVGAQCSGKCQCTDCHNWSGARDEEEKEEIEYEETNTKPPAFVEIPSKITVAGTACVDGSVSASSSSYTSSIAEKRIRRSKPNLRRRSKSHDEESLSLSQFYLGLPSPLHPLLPSESYEI